MLIVSEIKTDYRPASAGTFAATCCDVIDMGFMESTFDGKTKKQRKVRIVWMLAELRDDGSQFTVGRMYTLSLNEKSRLRSDLESWRGRPFTSDELAGFDIDSILWRYPQVTRPCFLKLTHPV